MKKMKKEKRDKIFFSPPIEAYKGNKPYIFVSYSHEDKNRIYPEILRLYDEGYHIWYDQGVKPGEIFAGRITDALKKCEVFVVFLSKHAVVSKHVEREIFLAIEHEIKIVPIYLEKAELTDNLKYQIGALQAIKKYEMVEDAYYRKIEEELPKFKLAEELEDTTLEYEETIEDSTGENSHLPLLRKDRKRKTHIYHVFISFKGVDADGYQTYDWTLAQNVYHFLTKKGLNVFHKNFSVKDELDESKKKSATETALSSSQIMVVVGMSLENITDKNIQYEWKRFTKLSVEGDTPDGIIISYIRDIDRSKLPETLRKNEVIVDSKNSLERLYLLISSMLELEKPMNIGDAQWKRSIKKGQLVRLINIKGDGQSEITIAPGDVIKVGRSNENDLVLNPFQISRYHAEIYYKKDGIFVKDLDSANGTFVNRHKVTWKELKDGDIVTFDVISYKVCLSSIDR